MKITKDKHKWDFGGLTLAKDKIYCNDVVFHWGHHPHGMKPWLIEGSLGNFGRAFCIVWANHEQDALDEAADLGLLDSEQIEDKDLKDYEVGVDSDGYPEYDGVVNLGNASDPFDSTNLGIRALNTKDFPPELIAAFAEARGAQADTLDDI